MPAEKNWSGVPNLPFMRTFQALIAQKLIVFIRIILHVMGTGRFDE
jgi:hypothetical protein